MKKELLFGPRVQIEELKSPMTSDVEETPDTATGKRDVKPGQETDSKLRFVELEAGVLGDESEDADDTQANTQRVKFRKKKEQKVVDLIDETLIFFAYVKKGGGGGGRVGF